MEDRANDVVIVGGGPVGMLLAAEIGRYGVATTVVETLPETHDEPRAGTLHARTVQSMARRGYVTPPDRSVAGSERMTTVPFHFAGRPTLVLEAPEAEGPPMLVLAQAEVERFFEDRARAAGARILRGTRAVDVVAQPDEVAVHIERNGGEREVLSAGYVVGCDGARSTVRQRAGITSTTHPPTFAGILGLVRLSEPALFPGGWTHGPTGSTLANVNPGGLSRVLTHEFGEPMPERNAPVALADLRSAASRVHGRDIGMDSPAYLGRFSDFSRLADTYRAGRVLLAGDAAHVHAPLGGQGLNTGLQDAFNLGWKLAMVALRQSPERLLDSYHSERHPVAAAVIANTRAQAALMRPEAAFEPLRDLMSTMLSTPEANSRLSDLITGQGVRYATGPGLTGTFLPNKPVGDTTVVQLLQEGRPLLLLTPDTADEHRSVTNGWQGRLTSFTVEDSPFDQPAVLCRPDGYVAWAGTEPARLAEALEHWFAPTATIAV